MSSYLSISISDINECTEGGDSRCEQVCINTAGSYACTCAEGYALNDDVFTCRISHCNGFKYSFFSNIIRLWNNLPLEAVNSETLLI